MAEVDLSGLSFFEGFDDASLQKVARLGEVVEAEAGATIVDQGDVGREAYVIEEGRVEIVVNGQSVATAGPGSLLGEMALLELRPRSARLVAATDCTLLSFGADGFRKILDEMPTDARAHLSQVNAAFRSQNEEIARGEKPRPITG